MDIVFVYLQAVWTTPAPDCTVVALVRLSTPTNVRGITGAILNVVTDVVEVESRRRRRRRRNQEEEGEGGRGREGMRRRRRRRSSGEGEEEEGDEE